MSSSVFTRSPAEGQDAVDQAAGDRADEQPETEDDQEDRAGHGSCRRRLAEELRAQPVAYAAAPGPAALGQARDERDAEQEQQDTGEAVHRRPPDTDAWMLTCSQAYNNRISASTHSVGLECQSMISRQL